MNAQMGHQSEMERAMPQKLPTLKMDIVEVSICKENVTKLVSLIFRT